MFARWCPRWMYQKLKPWFDQKSTSSKVVSSGTACQVRQARNKVRMEPWNHESLDGKFWNPEFFSPNLIWFIAVANPLKQMLFDCDASPIHSDRIVTYVLHELMLSQNPIKVPQHPVEHTQSIDQWACHVFSQGASIIRSESSTVRIFLKAVFARLTAHSLWEISTYLKSKIKMYIKLNQNWYQHIYNIYNMDMG